MKSNYLYKDQEYSGLARFDGEKWVLNMPPASSPYYSLCHPYCFSNVPEIRKVIYNPPATIILWEDGTKTVVKCCETDIYDPEKGFAMAIIKKLCGNTSAPFHRLFKTWVLESKDASDIQREIQRISIDGIGNRINDAFAKAFRSFKF